MTRSNERERPDGASAAGKRKGKGKGNGNGKATAPAAPAARADQTDTLILRAATAADILAIHEQWIDAQWAAREDTVVATEVERFPTWVAERDGEVVAGVLAVPFRQVVGGTTFEMAGIRGVTCAAHMRRRGIVDRLLRHALAELRPRYPISALYPFSPPFYEKFGYGTCSHMVRWRVLLDDLELPRPPHPPRRLSRADVPALAALIERELAAIGNGAVHPDPFWLDKAYFPRKENDTFPITMGWSGAGGALLAALCWRPMPGGGNWDKNRIFVRQWHGVDAAWRRRALGFVRNLSDQYVEVELDRPAGDLFYHHIRKPYRWDSMIVREGYRVPGATYETDWQARLLEPARALGERRALHGPGGTLAVELTDPVFGDLNGSFRWTVSASTPAWAPLGGGEVGEAGEAGAGSTLPRIALGIGDLSRIWYGAVGIYDLMRAGRVQCDDEAAAILHAAFGGFRCHMQVGF